VLAIFVLIVPTSYALAKGEPNPAFRVQFGIRTPMRDGVELSSDIWLPSKSGRYPSILVRTPYVKAGGDVASLVTPLAQFYVQHGYVVVVQDTRGRGDSDGKFNFFFSEGHDGYDTIEWIAAQPWSNGKVGMLGVSYLGVVQWLAAREHPPHLVCIAPTAAAGRWLDELPYQGGAFELEWAIQWLNATADRSVQGLNASGLDLNAILKERPLLTVDEKFGRRMPLYREFLQHDTLDNYWKRIQFTAEDFRRLDIPALTTTGWFDAGQPGALFYWRNMRVNSPAKNNQYLLIGPWTHLQTFVGGDRKLGGFEFSEDSVYDLKGLQLAFFDHFLKSSAGSFDFPSARIYVTGSNQWHDAQDYPPPDARNRALYFHSTGKANGLRGDGLLTWKAPSREPADHYTYDPENPVIPAEGEEDPGKDERYIEKRDDVLIYTSEPLKDPVEVIGEVVVQLFAASDARDTDFTARLLDVYPDGPALRLGPREVGIIRARYRKSLEHTELLTPGKAEHYQIKLYDLGHTFLPGHKIRVEISSSYAPVFNPNPNTGNPLATDTQSRPARQTIFHDRMRASYISLPVVPNP
jgi:putative CocE/NonD family hydrolase